MTFALYIVHEYNRSSYGYIVIQAVSQYMSTSETETVKPLAELTGEITICHYRSCHRLPVLQHTEEARFNYLGNSLERAVNSIIFS